MAYYSNLRQEHRCPNPCASPGICDIATAPQSVESIFKGKFDTFQYTKARIYLSSRRAMSHINSDYFPQYTQVARRLPCIVPISPDAITHDGPHVHSTDPKMFHFCETRCISCDYLCHLPLGQWHDIRLTKIA
jgi:hypothetical protein